MSDRLRHLGFLLTFRKPLIILAHIAAFAASLVFSFLVANNMQFRREWLVGQYPFFLLLFLAVKLPVFGLFKQYRGWWRYVSISDLLGILRASLVSTLIIVTIWFAVLLQIPAIRRALPPALAAISQGVFMADLFGTILLPAGLRMIIRLYHEEFRATEGRRLKRFLIVGAGNAGEALLREILRMPVVQYETIGFIDDDPVKQGIQHPRHSRAGNGRAVAEDLRRPQHRGDRHRHALGHAAATAPGDPGLRGHQDPVPYGPVHHGHCRPASSASPRFATSTSTTCWAGRSSSSIST